MAIATTAAPTAAPTVATALAAAPTDTILLHLMMLWHLHVGHRPKCADDLCDAEVNNEEHEDDDRGEKRHVDHTTPEAVI